MALPTWVQSTGAEGGSMVKDANYNNDCNANDIIIQQCCLITGAVTATPPAGWTTVSDISYSSSQRKITIWKRGAANETTPTWTSITAGARFFQTTLIRGCPTSGDPFLSMWSENSKASSTAVSIPMGTTNYSDILFVAMMVNFSAGVVTTWTDANLASVTERYDAAAGGMTPKTVTGELSTAGDGGTLTATLSVAGAQIWTVFPMLSTTSALSGVNLKPNFFQFF